MDNQLLAQMLMGQMGQQAQQPMGGMQPKAGAVPALAQGGNDLMKMMMLKKLMAQQQPKQPNPGNPLASMVGQPAPDMQPQQLQMPNNA